MSVARKSVQSARLGLFNAVAQSRRPLPHRIIVTSSPVRNYSLAPRVYRTLERANRAQFRPQSTLAERYTASTPPPPPPPEPRRSLLSRFFRFVVLATTSFYIGTSIMTADSLSPVIQQLKAPPTDAETLELFKPEPGTPAAELEAQIQAHPLLASLRQDDLLSEARPHLKIPAPMREKNLTAGTLLGDDMIGIPPIMFVAKDGSRMVAFHHVGPALCGHPGIVHGGLLATLLDEGLARCCFPALPHKIGMTASLKVDYKAPCQAGQFLVLRAETTKVEGRKAWVRGRLETLVDEEKGEVPLVLVEAEALFIEPRQAAQMAQIYAS